MSIFSKAKHYGLARKKYKFEMKIHRLILPTSNNKLICRILWSRRKKKSEKFKTSWIEGTEEFYINQVIIHNATIFLTHKTNQFQSKYTTISIEIKDNQNDKKFIKYCSFKIDLSDFINITSPNKIFNKHLKYKSTKGTKKAEIIFSMKSTEILCDDNLIINGSNDNNSSIFSNDDNININNDNSNVSIISKDIDSMHFNELKKKHVANQRKLMASSTPHLSNSSNSSHSSGNSKENNINHINMSQSYNQLPPHRKNKEILILRHNNSNNTNNTNHTPTNIPNTDQQESSSPYATYTKYAQSKQQQNEDEYKYGDEDEEEELSDNPPPFLVHTPQPREQEDNHTIISRNNNGYSPITNDSNTPISMNSNHNKYQPRIQINKHKKRNSSKNLAGSAISVCSTDEDDDDDDDGHDEEEKKEEEERPKATAGGNEDDEDEDENEDIDDLHSRFSWTLNTSLNRARNRSLISVGTIGSVDLDGLDLATPKSVQRSHHRLNNDELEELRQLRLDKIYWTSKLTEFDKLKTDFMNQENKMDKLKKQIVNLQKDRDRLQTKVSSLQTMIEHQKNEKYNSFGTFKYMTFNECDKLCIGDYIDHRDITGHYLLAKIINKKKLFIHIHYEGWASKWDIWINYKKECQLNKISIARSISRKSNTRFLELQIGDNIDINPIQRHKGWTQGKIKKMDKYSGQVQVEYIHQNEKYFYWAHLNDIKEIAPFMTKSCDL